MVAAALIGIVAWCLFRIDEVPRLAPDGRYYLTRPYDVPWPFAMRPLVPLLLGQTRGVWTVAAALGIVAQSVGMYLIAGTLVGPLLLLGLPAGARFSVRHPVLVDAVALGATLLLVGSAPSPHLLALWVPVLGVMREQAPILVALLTGEPWYLLGLVAPIGAGLLFGRPARVGVDNQWITDPWATTLAFRRGSWAHVRMILPLGVVLPLAMMTGPWARTTWAALALGVLPALRASDHGRALMWAAPVLIVLAVQAPIPNPLWPVLLLAHWCNPYRGA